jgi:transposase
VRRSRLSKRETLGELGVARSTFYRWQKRFCKQGAVGLVDRRPQPGSVWDRLRPEAEEKILFEAHEQPELSPGELACHLSD